MSGTGHGHGPEHGGPENKRIALLIAVLALVLAFSETLGKGAQTMALSQNIEASNLWSFFQAKTIRLTVLRTTAEETELALQQAMPPKAKEAYLRAAALAPEKRVVIARGGKGGRGNWHFKSSTNRTPRHANKDLRQRAMDPGSSPG